MQLLARRRQADQVEVDAAQERRLVGVGERLESAFLVLGGQEGVDRVGGPGRIFDGRDRGPDRLPERPVGEGLPRASRRRALGPPVDPGLEQATCSAVSGWPSGGIRALVVVGTRSMSRLPAVPGLDRRPAVAARRDERRGVEPQLRLLLEAPWQA